jgi:ASC-1-like (ASCH) protein
MEHQMKLSKGAFERVSSGKKKVEIRLFDEKRQRLRIGDTIIFSRLPDLSEQLTVKVTGLRRYGSFRELIENTPMKDLGRPDEYDKTAYLESMYSLYTKEEETRYGVLGIEIQPV